MKLLRIALLITADVTKWSSVLCAALAVGYLIAKLLGFNDSEFERLTNLSDLQVLAMFAWGLLGTVLGKVLRGWASKISKTDQLPTDRARDG